MAASRLVLNITKRQTLLIALITFVAGRVGEGGKGGGGVRICTVKGGWSGGKRRGRKRGRGRRGRQKRRGDERRAGVGGNGRGGGVRGSSCPKCSDIDSSHFEKWKRVACAFGSVVDSGP